MGLYNMLHTRMRCARCGQDGDIEIQFRFGLLNLLDYHVGDRVEWVRRKIVKNGGRPEAGTMVGEGYADCPLCQKDYWVHINVVEDVITGVGVDASRPGYVPDDS